MFLSELNAGKNTATITTYQLSYATPYFHLESVHLFPQTGQFPPIKPDNKVWSYKTIFFRKNKKNYFLSFCKVGDFFCVRKSKYILYELDMLSKLLICQ